MRKIKKIQIFLSGGGKNIYKVLEKIIEEDPFIFKNKTISYVVIAMETNKELFSLIIKEWQKLQAFFKDYNAKSVALIKKSNISEIYDNQVIILSGGNTKRLIQILRQEKFKRKLFSSSIKTVIGISAGAIALSEKGLGMLKEKPYFFSSCLGIVPYFVIPHSNKEKKQNYPQAIQLKDYETKSFLIKVEKHRPYLKIRSEK